MAMFDEVQSLFAQQNAPQIGAAAQAPQGNLLPAAMAAFSPQAGTQTYPSSPIPDLFSRPQAGPVEQPRAQPQQQQAPAPSPQPQAQGPQASGQTGLLQALLASLSPQAANPWGYGTAPGGSFLAGLGNAFGLTPLAVQGGPNMANQLLAGGLQLPDYLAAAQAQFDPALMALPGLEALFNPQSFNANVTPHGATWGLDPNVAQAALQAIFGLG